MNKKTKSLIPRYRFPEFKENDKWKYLSLEQIADISMGVSPPSTAYNENNEGLPLLQGNADIKDRQSSPRIHTKEITKECKIGDILLSVRAPVGTVAKSIHNACIGRGLATLKCYKDYEQNFLYQFLINYESKWGNISQGGTFDSVNSSEIKKLNIPIPSLPEQQKIADCLSSLDELITAENQQLEVLKTHKKGLMQKLFPEDVESSEDGSLDHPTPSGHPSKGGELRAVPKMRFPEFRGK
ncbi:MAG: restriction endonuclease subunit S, partial [Nanoarchaeota archaeon]|nr:restriction endonuclease subunit S [Nanoarchaeota archaeon]